MLRASCALSTVLAACSFTPSRNAPSDGNPGPGDDGSGSDSNPTTDGDPGPMIDPLHVPPAGGAPGTGDLTLTDDVDTTQLTIGGSSDLPTGVTFDSYPQASGPDVAVLHVKTLTVPSSASIRVTGTRAFIVVASGAIQIDGVIDGGAKRDQAGPGGSQPGMGPGAGVDGSHVSTFRDSGGSGAGFLTDGGTGGAATPCNPSANTTNAGTMSIDPAMVILRGGAGGGAAARPSNGCGDNTPGAGGGAIQLTSATRVSITGGITVGGGGGGGGRAQLSGDPQCNQTAGNGGGAGGAILLQSPIVELGGASLLAANGGGGGSSGGDPNGDDLPPEANGIDGDDGDLATGAASGGGDVGTWSAAGGDGGTTADPGDGVANNDCDGNGGGGGGSAGQIVFALPNGGGTTTIDGKTSPASTKINY